MRAIFELRVPNFEMPQVVAAVSAWHAAVGQKIVEGERLVEIVAGDVTVDLAAPVSGVLLEHCAILEQPLSAGQTLARIRAE